MTDHATNLAQNIRKLRDERGLTQQRLAELADVPRPTLASLESGAANPTLGVLASVAAALQVSIEELIGPPRSQVQLFKAGFGRPRRRNGSLLLPLLPESVPQLELSSITLQPTAQLVGVPHTPGTREYLSCIRGTIDLLVAGERWRLVEGDALVFRGDQRHSYRNPQADKECQAISVVCFGA